MNGRGLPGRRLREIRAVRAADDSVRLEVADEGSAKMSVRLKDPESLRPARSLHLDEKLPVTFG
ncbi:MAG: hypothetical protein LBP22_15205 [Deltaproteobacteria bacterium]|nr:hypothetical protein [Deltaproteobacteria bacterium]